MIDNIGKSPAILLKNHGVFTIVKDATGTVKAAVMIENVATTVCLTMLIGMPYVIPQKDVDKLHHH